MGSIGIILIKADIDSAKLGFVCQLIHHSGGRTKDGKKGDDAAVGGYLQRNTPVPSSNSNRRHSCHLQLRKKTCDTALCVGDTVNFGQIAPQHNRNGQAAR